MPIDGRTVPPIADRSGSKGAALRSAMFTARQIAGAYPSLFFPLYALKTGFASPLAVRRETDLVVEGFPRSGNTFALLALMTAQPRPLRTADHLHVPAQVLRAVAWNIPVLLIVREPDAAIRSLVVRYPYISPSQAAAAYSRFHERCWPLRDRVVVATFEQVTGRLGDVVARLNRAFGTDFEPFGHDPASEASVFELLDERNDALGGTRFSRYRPDPAKEIAKRQVDLRGCDRVLSECREWYSRFERISRDDPQDHRIVV